MDTKWIQNDYFLHQFYINFTSMTISYKLIPNYMDF